ncbi:MAG TPA: hypothetical protein VK935_06655 [Actinomycetospora sp.]|nr:hypothetical protein [Actinomycetospora sp.]
MLRGTPWAGLHRTLSGTSWRRGSTAAGLSAREIADYLGHERVSMTQDVYMSRRVAGRAAAAALERLNPSERVDKGCADLRPAFTPTR